jgi:hypothetical protein
MTQQQRTIRGTHALLALLTSSGLLLVADAGAEPASPFAERHRDLDNGERTIALERARAPAEQALRAQSGRNA